MCPIIHRVNAPIGSGTVVRFFHDAVHNGVAHQHIGVLHINFSTQNMFTFIKFAVFHPFEQIEIFFNRSISIRPINARLCWRAFLFGHSLATLRIYISFPFFDELNGPTV